SIVDATLSPAGGVFSGPGVTNSQFIVNDAGVGTHELKYVAVNQHGCRDSTIFTVVVHSNPDFTLDITQPNCSQSDGEIIINTIAGSAPFDYSIDDGLTSQTNNDFTNLSAGPYNIVVTDDNGCISAMDTTLSTNGANDPSFTFNDYCEGDNNGPTNIASSGGVFSIIAPTTGGATIDSTTGVISNGVGGTTYSVQHVTTGICGDTAVVDVTVHTVPNIDFSANPIEGVPPLIVNFTNNSTGGDNYTWEFGDGAVEQNNNTNVSHSFNDEGVFVTQLFGETNNGMCTNSGTITIITMFPIINYTFPNVFTPNGDNNNDSFKFVYHENVKSLNIVILNRWGNVVFESDDINFQWNGNINNTGGECVDGVYFYKAELENFKGDKIQEHGFVHLNRD
ncbi:MAG TPA: gliding motility-associated C-terminal domain-containing protein, partial [Brumimicrobium sp.]|nr:gliding motility-associated C-terminal domain-containing protein [Brumimicrobium sp.]